MRPFGAGSGQPGGLWPDGGIVSVSARYRSRPPPSSPWLSAQQPGGRAGGAAAAIMAGEHERFGDRWRSRYVAALCPFAPASHVAAGPFVTEGDSDPVRPRWGGPVGAPRAPRRRYAARSRARFPFAGGP